jgi:hypothetical protein
MAIPDIDKVSPIPSVWSWFPLLILGYLLILSYFILMMIFPSNPNASSLGGAILIISLALFFKTQIESVRLNKRITEGEIQIALLKLELTALKGK